VSSRAALLAAQTAVTVLSHSTDQTRDFGAALGAVAAAGDRIALIGPLGAGKTQFAKGFATGLGVREVVNSPSFTLMAEYAGRLPLFHQDLYRLNGTEEILGGGMLDERQLDGVTLSEWAERMPASLDPERLTVRFDVLGDEDRQITVIAATPRHGRYIRAAATWQPR
jgi:tRNA threonylcarbamoyladenosine biosynthesis protein TsaE